MRIIKTSILIVYTIILSYLIYRDYQTSQADIISEFLKLITLWFAGVVALSRIYDWLFHENTEENRKQKEKLEQEKKKEVELENEKKSVYASLLSEIKINQDRLKPLANALDNKTSEEDKFPEGLTFESRIYSALLGKLGLLDNEKRDILVTYYSKLKHIEEEYNEVNLKTVHGFPTQDLAYFELSRITNNKWNKIEGFLVNTKKVYDLGEELINELKK